MNEKEHPDQYPDDETARRLDRAIKRSLEMPPKPHKGPESGDKQVRKKRTAARK